MATAGDEIVRFEMRLSRALVARIDAWRTVHMPLQPRIEALRRLLEEALNAYPPPGSGGCEQP